MNISRRTFVTGATAFSFAGVRTAFATEGEPRVLRASRGQTQLAPAAYPETSIWGYEGTVPGPVLRIPQGGRLKRRFVNNLPQPSTIHWHGVRIDNAMDGVPDLTQAAVPSDGSFLYDFVAPDAGTYWYHPHNRTWEQMARGLYGALIVEEPHPPSVDRDEVLLIDDWRLTQEAQIAENFGTMMDWSHAGRIGNWVTVNGDGAFRMATNQHERLRLRLVNTANSRIFVLEPHGVEGWVVAIDGQPLAKPTQVGRISLSPAQRVDLIVDVTAAPGDKAGLVAQERDGSFVIANFDIKGKARTKRLSAPKPLAPNPVQSPGPLNGIKRVSLRMEGGAMGRMQGAKLGGKMMGMSELVEAGKVWAFNGMADMPKEPFLTAAKGETVRIEMINDTSWPHAMHIHGHHFQKVVDGQAVGPLRDTILVIARQTTEIALVADNPGDWLLHCHMLEHSASGMMTWLRVTG